MAEGIASTTVAFGDVVRLSKERTVDPDADGFERYVGLEHIEPGSLRIRRWGDVAEGTTFTSVFRPGQVLFGKRRAYQRKVAVADFDGVCSGDIYVLESKDSSVLLPELVPFICLSGGFLEHAVATSSGSLSPRTSWDRLARFEFSLQAPELQRRAVSSLTSAEALLQAVRQTQRASSSLERAFLKDSFGDAYGKRRAQFDYVRLDALADVRTGLAKSGTSAKGEARPYLAVSNVLDGALSLDEVKTIKVEAVRAPRYELREGDVLMTEGGDLDKLGRGTVWQGEIQGCLHQNHIFAVRVRDARLDPWYLAAVARSTYGRSYFLGCAKRTSNLASVNKQQVSAFEVPLLSVDAMGKWLSRYDAIRQAEAAIAARSRLVEATLASLVDAFVRGAAQ